MSGTLAAKQPTIVFVHGAYHRKEHFSLIEGALSELGFDTLAVDLPVDIPDLTQEDDAQTVANATEGLDNIMVVGHSRAGDFLAKALQLTTASRRIGVFLCASGFGVELPTDMPPRNTPEFLEGIADGPLGLTTYNRWRARRYFYPYHPDDETASVFRAVRAIALALLRPQRGRPQVPESLPQSLPEGIKFYSIHGSRDAIVSPRWSTRAEEVLGLESVTVPDGHSPYIANPRRLAGILANLAMRDPTEASGIASLPRPRIPPGQGVPPNLQTYLPPRSEPGHYTNDELRALFDGR